MDYGLGSVIGGLVGSAANIYMNERNNQVNMQEARLQNQWNIEQWQRENAYNSPLAQLQRLKEAGINPGLAYANGNLMNEAAQSPEMTSAAGQLRAHYVDPMLMANIGLVEAQTEKTKTESDVMAQKLPEELNQLRKQNEEIKNRIKLLDQDCQAKAVEIENLKKQGRKLDDDLVHQQFQRIMQEKEFEIHVNEYLTARERTIAEIEKWSHENSLTDSEKALKDSLTKLNRQEFEFNVQANVQRLLGLKLDNVNKKMDTVLKIDTHKMYGQQITLNGFQINAGRLSDQQNLQVFRQFNTKFKDDPLGHLAGQFLGACGYLTNQINPVRLFK